MTTLTEHQFHAVWTDAVGMDRYDKKLFQELMAKMRDKGRFVTENVSSNSCVSRRIFYEHTRKIVEDRNTSAIIDEMAAQGWMVAGFDGDGYCWFKREKL